MDYLSEDRFQLSSFDFSSSFGLYSSDEDDDSYNEQQLDHNCENEDDDEDEEMFIEYELHQPESRAATPIPPPPVPFQVEAASADHRDNDELEIRLSFSAFVPFPGFFPSPTIDPANIFSFRRSFFKTGGGGVDANSQPPTTDNSSPKGLTSGGTGNSSTPIALTVDNEDEDDDHHRISHYNKSWRLVRNRKASSTKINCAANIGIMKLLVKLRSMIVKLQSIRTVNNNRRRHNCPTRRQQSWRVANLMKPFENWSANWRKGDLKKLMTIRKSNGGGERSSSKVVAVEELKLDVLRKLSGSKRITKSCPSSIKSSPVHDAAAASLHAAIAHCKKSLGQTNEFCF